MRNQHSGCYADVLTGTLEAVARYVYQRENRINTGLRGNPPLSARNTNERATFGWLFHLFHRGEKKCPCGMWAHPPLRQQSGLRQFHLAPAPRRHAQGAESKQRQAGRLRYLGNLSSPETQVVQYKAGVRKIARCREPDFVE